MIVGCQALVDAVRAALDGATLEVPVRPGGHHPVTGPGGGTTMYVMPCRATMGVDGEPGQPGYRHFIKFEPLTGEKDDPAQDWIEVDVKYVVAEGRANGKSG